MLFDYRSLYKNYSDAELADIIRHPDKYQPEAVAAADLLAKERGIDTTQKERITETTIPAIDTEDSNALRTKAREWLDKRTNFLLMPGDDAALELFAPYEGSDEEKSKIFDGLPNRLALSRHTLAIRKFAVAIGALALLDTFMHIFKTLYYVSYYSEPILLTISSFFDEAVLLTAIVLLYRVKKAGWALVVGIAAYRCFGAVFWFNSFPTSIKIIVSACISVYALIFLFQAPKRNVLRITNENIGWTLAVTFALCTLTVITAYSSGR